MNPLLPLLLIVLLVLVLRASTRPLVSLLNAGGKLPWTSTLQDIRYVGDVCLVEMTD